MWFGKYFCRPLLVRSDMQLPGLFPQCAPKAVGIVCRGPPSSDEPAPICTYTRARRYMHNSHHPHRQSNLQTTHAMTFLFSSSRLGFRVVFVSLASAVWLDIAVLAGLAFFDLTGHVRTVAGAAFDGPSAFRSALIDGSDDCTRDFFPHICISDGCVS